MNAWGLIALAVVVTVGLAIVLPLAFAAVLFKRRTDALIAEYERERGARVHPLDRHFDDWSGDLLQPDPRLGALYDETRS